MTRDQYHRLIAAIKSCHEKGRFPTGIKTIAQFNEFKWIVGAYFQHEFASTINEDVAMTLMRYGIPMFHHTTFEPGEVIGWEIQYKEKSNA